VRKLKLRKPLRRQPLRRPPLRRLPLKRLPLKIQTSSKTKLRVSKMMPMTFYTTQLEKPKISVQVLLIKFQAFSEVTLEMMIMMLKKLLRPKRLLRLRRSLRLKKKLP